MDMGRRECFHTFMLCVVCHGVVGCVLYVNAHVVCTPVPHGVCSGRGWACCTFPMVCAVDVGGRVVHICSIVHAYVYVGTSVSVLCVSKRSPSTGMHCINPQFAALHQQAVCACL